MDPTFENVSDLQSAILCMKSIRSACDACDVHNGSDDCDVHDGLYEYAVLNIHDGLEDCYFRGLFFLLEYTTFCTKVPRTCPSPVVAIS
jgi:hypothetical protein